MLFKSSKLQSFIFEELKSKEINKYNKFGFDFNSSLNELKSVFKKLNFNNFNENTSMHFLLFSCLNQQNKGIKNILEIGTYKGESTKFLSELFNNSKIYTFDLPDNDPIFLSSYSREDPKVLDDFLKKRKKNLNSKNIKFIQSNSFFIPELVSNIFDLIWIDGDHLLPTIAWDICNAYHLCKKDGWIMFDDIIKNTKTYKDGKYGSGDAYRILNFLENKKVINNTYFYKRLKPSYLDPNSKTSKYISLSKKIS